VDDRCAGAIGHGCDGTQHHARADQPAREVQAAAGGIDPELMPLAVGGVVAVEALALAALGARPVLEQRALARDDLDAVLAGLVAVRGEDVPLADPEVELMVFRPRAGRLSRRLGERGCGEAGAHAQCDKVETHCVPSGWPVFKDSVPAVEWAVSRQSAGFGRRNAFLRGELRFPRLLSRSADLLPPCFHRNSTDTRTSSGTSTSEA